MPLDQTAPSSIAALPPPRLFHVSDHPGIPCFHPRTPPSFDAGVRDPVVWAIAERLLHNYLLPRDCPRVTYYAHAGTSNEDRLRFLPASRHGVALEASWFDRVRQAHLWLYELPADTFTRVDATAEYYVSRQAVVPLSLTPIPNLVAALLERDVELRLLPSLWPLRDAVASSTLAFSFIRLRHAAPRLAASA